MNNSSDGVKVIKKEIKKIEQVCKILKFLKDRPEIGSLAFKSIDIKFEKSGYKVYLQNTDNSLAKYTISQKSGVLRVSKVNLVESKNLDTKVNMSIAGEFKNIIPNLESYTENLKDVLENEQAKKQKIKQFEKELGQAQDAAKKDKSKYLGVKRAQSNLDTAKVQLSDFDKDLNKISKLIKKKESYEKIDEECKRWSQIGKIEEYVNKFKNDLANANTYRKYREALGILIKDKRQYKIDLNEKNRERLEEEYNKLMDNPPGGLDGLINDLKQGLRALILEDNATEQQIKCAKEIKIMVERADDELLQKEFPNCDKNKIMEKMLDMDNKELHDFINRIDKDFQIVLASQYEDYSNLKHYDKGDKRYVKSTKTQTVSKKVFQKESKKKSIGHKLKSILPRLVRSKSTGNIKKDVTKKHNVLRRVKSDSDINVKKSESKRKKIERKLKRILLGLVRSKSTGDIRKSNTPNKVLRKVKSDSDIAKKAQKENKKKVEEISPVKKRRPAPPPPPPKKAEEVSQVKKRRPAPPPPKKAEEVSPVRKLKERSKVALPPLPPKKEKEVTNNFSMEGVKNYQFKKFDKVQKNDVSVSEVLLRKNKSNLKENKNVTKNKEKNITLNRSNE